MKIDRFNGKDFGSRSDQDLLYQKTASASVGREPDSIKKTRNC